MFPSLPTLWKGLFQLFAFVWNTPTNGVPFPKGTSRAQKNAVWKLMCFIIACLRHSFIMDTNYVHLCTHQSPSLSPVFQFCLSLAVRCHIFVKYYVLVCDSPYMDLPVALLKGCQLSSSSRLFVFT